MLEIKYAVMPWTRLWAIPPTFTGQPAFVKPNKIATVETLINEYTGQELIALALSNPDLYGNATLDVAKVNTLNPDDVLAMYLNVRYAVPTPDHLLPLRRAHVFGQTAHLFGWYILMSAILTKIYDQTRLTIDPHLIYRADQLGRALAQVNWVIRQMSDAGINPSNPGDLIIGAAMVTDKVGTYGFIVFDEKTFETWTTNGHTVQEAWDHWQTHKTQPTI